MDALDIYLADIRRYPLLTQAQEIELSRQIRRGQAAARELGSPGTVPDEQQQERLRQEIESGQRARRQFIDANYRLVVKIARRYAHFTEETKAPLLDLIQEGNLGLLTAVDGFDPELGHRFSTYAMYPIRWAIQRRGLPSRRDQACLSLDAPLLGESGLVADEYMRIGDAEASASVDVDWKLEREFLQKLLAQLPPWTRKVLELRFGWEDGRSLTLVEIAQEQGVTAEWVRQTERTGLKKLRNLYFRQRRPAKKTQAAKQWRPSSELASPVLRPELQAA